MANPIQDPVLAEIVRRVVEAFRPERVYLFGSRAREESGPDSDYGLLIVVPDDASPEWRRSRLAYECLWGTGQLRKAGAPEGVAPATVLREGRLIYAA